MDIKPAILNEIDCWCSDPIIYQNKKKLWITTYKVSSSSDCRKICTILYVSRDPCGAFQSFGSIEVFDSEIILRLKKVWGILKRNGAVDIFSFDFCDPDFPGCLYEILRVAACNALRCFDLEHKRRWNHYSRTLRNRQK